MLDLEYFQKRLAVLVAEEQKALLAYGEWSGARQEVENCIAQIKANEAKKEEEGRADGLAGLRSILPKEAIFPGDKREDEPESERASG